MVELKRLAIGLGMVLGMTMLLHGQTTANGQSPTASSPKPAKSEEYRELTRKDHLTCKARNVSLHGNQSKTWKLSGSIQSFGCGDKGGTIKIIELESTKVVDSRLEIKEFGTILISNVMDEGGMVVAVENVTATGWTSLTFLMKESQIKKLRASLGF